jgi:hypothetical protein
MKLTDFGLFAAEVGFALTNGVVSIAKNTKAKTNPSIFLFNLSPPLSLTSPKAKKQIKNIIKVCFYDL